MVALTWIVGVDLCSLRGPIFLQPHPSITKPHPMPFPRNYSHHHPYGYQPPRTPLPPPPPTKIGYTPNFFAMPSSYINTPSSVAPPARGVGPGFGMGVGAGALAAGAVIFGDDFMSGFDPGASREASPYKLIRLSKIAVPVLLLIVKSSLHFSYSSISLTSSVNTYLISIYLLRQR